MYVCRNHAECTRQRVTIDISIANGIILININIDAERGSSIRFGMSSKKA